MKYRQVHLDFHNSETIPAIGQNFSRIQFQEMLKLGRVESVTVFAKCMHGWSYYPSACNEMHPGLTFDLLGEMIEAAHEIDVRTPVYISAGLDDKEAKRHPEWLIRDKEGHTPRTRSFLLPGQQELCLNSPYTDLHLLEQIKEVVSRYDGDGIFLDIVGVRECYCHNCIEAVRASGGNPLEQGDMQVLWEKTYANYVRKVRAAVDAIKPGMSIFHNSGHIQRGRRDLLLANSHLELESLPTGGWGYDHFPISARYVQKFGIEYLGMTGKFHTHWGEFGGYKHPNALRYETALMLAHGAKCSVGDQLHPSGKMDPFTYELIGQAYREVEKKEAWCADATNIADVALLSLESTNSSNHLSDAGALRILLEEQILFDVIDLEAEFAPYKVVILPDEIQVDDKLAVKLDDYVQNGGKVLATGKSGLNADGDQFAIDLGVSWVSENPYQPDYCVPDVDKQDGAGTAFVFYGKGQKVALAGGVEIARRENPYYNRKPFYYCSHQHFPNSGEYGGPGIVEHEHGIYIAWNVFEDYAAKGSLIVKSCVADALNRLLPDKTLETSLPAQGKATLQHQLNAHRFVLHLLYAAPVKKGINIEVIEDIVPMDETHISLRLQPGAAATGRHRQLPCVVKHIYLAPQMKTLTWSEQDGLLQFQVPRWECHQMVIIEYDGAETT